MQRDREDQSKSWECLAAYNAGKPLPTFPRDERDERLEKKNEYLEAEKAKGIPNVIAEE